MDGADPKLLQAALDWACGPGKVDCTALLQGQSCYDPDNVQQHASYAFDSYYHETGMAAGACEFNGVATITTTDPSKLHFPPLENLLQNLVLLCRETCGVKSASRMLLFTYFLLH
jgi:hypothetical protein